jgi:hypothetical protein
VREHHDVPQRQNRENVISGCSSGRTWLVDGHSLVLSPPIAAGRSGIGLSVHVEEEPTPTGKTT